MVLDRIRTVVNHMWTIVNRIRLSRSTKRVMTNGIRINLETGIVLLIQLSVRITQYRTDRVEYRVRIYCASIVS